MVKYENFTNEVDDDCAVILENEQPPAVRDDLYRSEFTNQSTVTSQPTSQPLAQPQVSNEPRVVPNTPLMGTLLQDTTYAEWCLFGCCAPGFACNSLTKVLGIRYGLYKFILPFIFYFTFFEMIQMHAKTTNQETMWWILKIFEGGLWLMLIYFFSELRSGIKSLSKIRRGPTRGSF